ncbi:MAG: caspase family protein [Pseudomonadota bacterium]
MLSRTIRLIALAILLVIGANPAQAEVRALILASDYGAASDPDLRLSNPVVDGRAVAASLRKAGVTDLRLVEEANAQRWQQEFESFARRLSRDDIAFVYYAGHGFQVSGQNYFVTADGDTLIALEEVMKQLTARAKGTIMVVDACRENPLSAQSDPFTVLGIDQSTSRTMATVRMGDIEAKSRGLAQLGDLRGLSAIVLFSTEPGNVALDGDPGSGSPFAKYAARELGRRQSLDSAFRRIAVAVNRATKGQQSPWRQGDLPFDVFLAGMTDFPTP